MRREGKQASPCATTPRRKFGFERKGGDTVRKKSLVLAAGLAVLLLSAPALASGDVGIYGSYWDTKDLNDAGGAGLKVGIPLGDPEKTPVALAFRGSWFDDLASD